MNSILSTIKASPLSVEFDQVIAHINEHYAFTPARFTNGIGDNIVINEKGTNEGSLRIFSFAKLNNLNEEQTLACFGKYYREDVVQNPDGNDHGNIRNFMQYGWAGISFDDIALAHK